MQRQDIDIAHCIVALPYAVQEYVVASISNKYMVSVVNLTVCSAFWSLT